MSSSRHFETFAARLREFIRATMGEVANHFLQGVRAEPAGADVFERLALELFSLQLKHNPAYRKLCALRDLTAVGVGHWSQIPAVPAAAFKEFDLTSLAPAERTTVFYSSGTTGHKPSRHFHSPDSLATYEVSLWPWFARHFPGFNDEERPALVVLTPEPAATPHSSLVHMFDTLRRQALPRRTVFLGRVEPDGSWTLDLERTKAELQRAAETQTPVFLLGTAFSFVHLVDFLAEHELRLQAPAGSRAMETGGYKGRSRILPKEALHSAISERLGIPRPHIVCEYGMSELSSQAYDHAVPQPGEAASRVIRRFEFPPWARAQVISPETGREVREGETGLLRIFDLANVYSVMAIQTEDLAIRRGHGFELLGRALAAEPRGCSLMAASVA